MNVAKLVMSSTSPDRSRAKRWTIRRPSSVSMARRSAVPRWSMASQNRRWSSAASGSGTHRGPAVLAHQSAKPSLEQGSTTRLAVASERQVGAHRGGRVHPPWDHRVDHPGHVQVVEHGPDGGQVAELLVLAAYRPVQGLAAQFGHHFRGAAQVPL